MTRYVWEDRLEALESRVARVERVLSLAPAQEPIAPPPVPAQDSAIVAPVSAAESAGPTVLAPPATQSDAERRGTAQISPSLFSREPQVPAILPVSKPSRGTVDWADRTQDLEWVVGTRWLAWVGAIVVVIAVALFVKLAHDQGWFGLLSPQMRCALAYGFGFLLLATGEVALRKINRLAAVGLFAAGLGTLYLCAFATFRYFSLVSQETAFMLAAATAGLGVAVSVRARMLVIAVLSISAGYLAPVLLPAKSAVIFTFPLYLTMLLGTSLVLSAGWGGTFRHVRWVGMAGLMVLGGLWAATLESEHWALVLVFLSLWWLVVTGECALAARREQSSKANAVASFAMTAWYSVTACQIMAVHEWVTPEHLSIITLLLSAAAMALACWLDPRLHCLHAGARAARTLMAASLCVQGGLLLLVSVALLFESTGRTAAWLALSLAAIELARRMQSRGVNLFALLAGTLGVLHLLVQVASERALQRILFTCSAFDVPLWLIYVAGGAAVVQFAAHRYRSSRLPQPRGVPIVLNVVSVAMLAFAWDGAARGATVTVGLVLLGLALLGLYAHGRRQGFFEVGDVVTSIAIFRWCLHDTMGTRLAPAWQANAQWPLANATFLGGVLISIATLLAARAFARARQIELDSATAQRARHYFSVGVLVAAGLLWWGLSFELDRAVMRFLASPPGWYHGAWGDDALRMQGLVGLWALGAMGLFAAGRRYAQSRWVVAGWSVLSVAAAVWLTGASLAARGDHGEPLAARPILNLQCAVGTLLIVLLILAARGAAAIRSALSVRFQWEQVCWTLCAMCGLWLGSFEAERLVIAGLSFGQDASVARHAALSVCWALYALGLIAVGFRFRARPYRVAGLALFGVTLAKVLLIDLSSAATVYRVISLLGVGLLCVIASAVYARLERGLRPNVQAAESSGTGAAHAG